MKNDYWIIDWQDQSGDSDHNHKEAARSPERAVERIRVILADETIIDDEQIDMDGDYHPEAERPAFDVLFEDEDPITVTRDLRDEIKQETSNGTIVVTPCWGDL